MTFKEYQEKAKQTAIYPNQGENPLYVYLGLSGELSELIDKFFFSFKTFTAEDIMKEEGDIFWYFSMMSLELEVDISERVELFLQKFEKKDTYNKYERVLKLFVEMNKMSEIFKKLIRDGGSFKEPDKLKKLREIYLYSLTLFFDIVSMIGIHPEIILDKNIEKLFHRKERNKLSGSGDDR